MIFVPKDTIPATPVTVMDRNLAIAATKPELLNFLAENVTGMEKATEKPVVSAEEMESKKWYAPTVKAKVHTTAIVVVNSENLFATCVEGKEGNIGKALVSSVMEPVQLSVHNFNVIQ